MGEKKQQRQVVREEATLMRGGRRRGLSNVVTRGAKIKK